MQYFLWKFYVGVGKKDIPFKTAVIQKPIFCLFIIPQISFAGASFLLLSPF